MSGARVPGQFSPQFKAEAVQMVIETGRPIARVARDLGTHDGTLANWVNAWRRREPGDRPAVNRAKPVQGGPGHLPCHLRMLLARPLPGTHQVNSAAVLGALAGALADRMLLMGQRAIATSTLGAHVSCC